MDSILNTFITIGFAGPLVATFLLGFTTIILLYWYSSQKHSYWKDLGIPYVKPQPFLGSVLVNARKIVPVSNDYLKLEPDDLLRILSSDTLNVKTEEFVFWALMRWLEHDPSNRQTLLPNLLKCIRFGFIDQQFHTENIQNNPYVSSNAECHIFKDFAIDRNALVMDSEHPFLRPRTPSEIILVIGGISGGSANTVIETFDRKSNRWFLSLFSDNTPRAYHGILWHKGFLYMIGGIHGNQCFNTMKRFNPVSHVWEEKSCLHEQRGYVSVAVVGDALYAIGGYDGRNISRTCERYDIGANQWSMMASMNQVRSDASADSLNGKIYIAGGFNGREVLHSAECFDTVENQWSYISCMNVPRRGLKVVAYCEKIYVMGGLNENMTLSSVERYDPRTRSWSVNVPPMSQGQRSNFATAVLDDCLYVIGGFDGLNYISSVECFNSQKNAWTVVKQLNLDRSALSACTVKGIPNIEEYTFLGLRFHLVTTARYRSDIRVLTLRRSMSGLWTIIYVWLI